MRSTLTNSLTKQSTEDGTRLWVSTLLETTRDRERTRPIWQREDRKLSQFFTSESLGACSKNIAPNTRKSESLVVSENLSLLRQLGSKIVSRNTGLISFTRSAGSEMTSSDECLSTLLTRLLGKSLSFGVAGRASKE